MNRSSYYHWIKRPLSNRDKENEVLLKKINDKFQKHKGRYGSPRIYQELKRDGINISKKRVTTIMKKNRISVKTKKRFVKTTDSNHDNHISPNLLERDFISNKPNEKWVSDLTYVSTQEGWLYLCVIIDLFSRKIIGWSMASHMKASLVVDAFLMAALTRKPSIGLLFHSDRGSQYTSIEFRKILKSYGVKQSMSRKGDCWDNACAETFFKTIKREEIYTKNYANFNSAKSSIFEYIEIYYNRNRLHSSIGYMTPYEYENVNYETFHKVA